jgi:hypothetical protein
LKIIIVSQQKNNIMKSFKLLNGLYFVLVLLSMMALVVSCERKTDIADTTLTQIDPMALHYEPQSIETVVSNYQQAYPKEGLDTVKITAVLTKFMEMMHFNERFGNKKPCHIQPIYAYGVTGIAYHEVWFADADKKLAGWVLLSQTDKDYPVVNFSHGIPYSAKLVGNSKTTDKVFRFGVSYYVLEQNGEKVAENGQMPSFVMNAAVNKSETSKGNSADTTIGQNKSTIQLQEGIDFFTIYSYEILKKRFPESYFTENRQKVAHRISEQFFSGNKKLRRDAYNYRWISGDFGHYTQILPYTGYNPYSCYSGCTNNAWANLYAWWDKNRAKDNLIPTTYDGETSPIYRNTIYRRASVDPVQMSCRAFSGTYCDGNQGATLFSDSWKAYQYAPSIGYGYDYWYQWSTQAGGAVNLANILVDGLGNNYTPVKIGANAHAYLAYGYAQWDTNTDLTWAYCYPGWRTDDSQDVWILWHDFNNSVRMYVN